MLVKLFGGPVAALIERVLIVGRARGRLLLLRSKLDAGPVGQHLQGLAKIAALALHYEAKDIAADIADPALPRLPVGIDLQAGAAVVMPRAAAHKAAAGSAQLEVLAHQLDDIRRLADLLLGVSVRHDPLLEL